MKSKIVLLWLGIVVVVLVGALVLWKTEWVNSSIYREVARRKIYPRDSMETRYPGEGENRRANCSLRRPRRKIYSQNAAEGGGLSL